MAPYRIPSTTGNPQLTTNTPISSIPAATSISISPYISTILSTVSAGP